MPHIVIEVSANLDEQVDLDALVSRAHAAALETGVFPVGGTRTRLIRHERFRIADGDPRNAFVHCALRIGHGRDEATRRRAAEHVFTAVCDLLDAAFERGPLAISLELSEIDPATSFKRNNIHEYVKARG